MKVEQIKELISYVKTESLHDFTSVMVELLGDKSKKFMTLLAESKKIPPSLKHRNDPFEITKACADVFGVDATELRKTRYKISAYANARRMAITICMDLGTFTTLCSCGKWFNRDHATVVYSRKTHHDLLETDMVYRNKFEQVMKSLELPESTEPIDKMVFHEENS